VPLSDKLKAEIKKNAFCGMQKPQVMTDIIFLQKKLW